jgi:hypothetical protein
VTITNGAGAITINATGSGGTVTSVAALTLGTTGTDLSSTVANGTTTPVITLNVPTASAANRGALSAADWTTFNGKYSVGGALGTPSSGTVTNLTGTASININGTVGATTASTVAATTVVASSTIKGATTISVGNATPSASGAGITFPATQSASTNANTLDDYEEGTWTPTFSRNGANPSLTYTASGAYTKVGRLVTVSAKMSISAVAAQGTGANIVQGLPFTPEGTYTSFGTVYFNSAFATIVTYAVSVEAVSSYFLFKAAINSTSNVDANFTVGELYFSITYYV